MDNETDKLINEQLQSLSEPIKRAIASVPWQNRIKEISIVNHLSVEQISALQRETMFVIYGLENPKDYVSNITNELGITEDMALKIGYEVMDKIFDPILSKIETYSKPSEQQVDPHPMVEKGEVAHEVPHVDIPPAPIAPKFVPPAPPPPAPTIAPTPPPAPQILREPEIKAIPPQPEKPKEELKTYSMMKKSAYPGGADPYREPLN